MNKAKINVGFSIDKGVVRELDSIVESSGYLQAIRSEVVDIILSAFFKDREARREGEKSCLHEEERPNLTAEQLHQPD